MSTNTAILIMDFINDIVHKDSPMALASQLIQEHQVIEKANQLIQWGRNNEHILIYVKVGFPKNYLNCPTQSPLFSKAKENQKLCLGTWGTEYHEKLLAPRMQDYQLVKSRVSCFYATSLATVLRANKIEKLYLSGVSSDMVVQSTAREAHDRDYQVFIVPEACMSAQWETHEHSMKQLARLAQMVQVDSL